MGTVDEDGEAGDGRKRRSKSPVSNSEDSSTTFGDEHLRGGGEGKKAPLKSEEVGKWIYFAKLVGELQICRLITGNLCLSLQTAHFGRYATQSPHRCPFTTHVNIVYT